MTASTVPAINRAAFPPERNFHNGETKIFCDCQIDPETEKVSIVPEKRTIIGPYPEETVDDMVETLDEEYVLMNGSYKIPVYRNDDGEYHVKERES